MAVQRISILDVPVDVCGEADVEKQVMEILSKPGVKHIVFLSLWDLLHARNKRKEYSKFLNEADMILPVSKSILWAAKVLKKKVPVRYNPFSAVISVMTTLDQHYKSLFLLGGHRKSLQIAEYNVKETFPNLQVVGRYIGHYPKYMEKDIVQAIYKSSPSLVLVSDGIKEKAMWSYNRRNSFQSSIFLYYHDAIGIFSERTKRVSEETFNRGLEIWTEILHNPLKLFLFFPYLMFVLNVLLRRIFKKEDNQSI